MTKILISDPDEIKTIIKSALSEFEKERIKAQGEPLFTINQVAKKFGKSHATITKMVESGMIRSTPNRLIPESALVEFLGNTERRYK